MIICCVLQNKNQKAIKVEEFIKNKVIMFRHFFLALSHDLILFLLS